MLYAPYFPTVGQMLVHAYSKSHVWASKLVSFQWTTCKSAQASESSCACLSRHKALGSWAFRELNSDCCSCRAASGCWAVAGHSNGSWCCSSCGWVGHFPLLSFLPTLLRLHLLLLLLPFPPAPCASLLCSPLLHAPLYGASTSSSAMATTSPTTISSFTSSTKYTMGSAAPV